MHRFIKTNWHFNRNSKRLEKRKKQAGFHAPWVLADYFNVSIDFLVGGTELGRQPALYIAPFRVPAEGDFYIVYKNIKAHFFNKKCCTNLVQHVIVRL